MVKDNEWEERSPRYLVALTSSAAAEIDKRIVGTQDSFDNVAEFARLLEKYRARPDDNPFVMYHFPYWPIWNVETRIYGKHIRKMPQFALELRARRSGLESIEESTPQKLANLREYFFNLSREYQLLAYPTPGFRHPYRRDLVNN